MAVRFTAENLQHAYEFLASTPPFRGWGLPDAEDVRFRVVRDPALRGWYNVENGAHVIAVSSRTIGYTNNIIATVAHEMIHLYLREVGAEGRGEHGRAFNKLAAQVCRIHGWDTKLF